MQNQPPISLTARKAAPSSLSIVIPCYNEEEVLPVLHQRLLPVLEEIGVPYEVILVDDGSKDRTWPLMQEIAAQHASFKVVRLARNFGHQIALTCGLDQVRGEVTVIMDADLQDPPELIPQMLELWQQGYDVVYGQRRQRHGETFSKKFFAWGFYRLFTRMTGITIPQDTGDFRLMDKKALEGLRSLRERHRFIRGMVSWIGLHQTPLLYDRPERAAGETKYPFKKSLLLAFDAITAFSYTPLRLASYLGIFISAFAFLYIAVVIVLKILGINFPGYTSIMASILLLGGVQLIVLGLIGEYVGRIYEQGQMRPLYLIDKICGEPFATTVVVRELNNNR